MLPRRFTTKIDQCHRGWLGQALGIPKAGHNGIDLVNDFFAVELKAKLKAKDYSINFAVNADQVNDFPQTYGERQYYWAFMKYTLSKPVCEVVERDDLEQLVTSREVWCLPWTWVQSFPISYPKRSGPFRYVPIKQLPKKETMTIFEQGKGKIYAPRDTDLEALLINRALSYAQEEDQNTSFYYEEES